MKEESKTIDLSDTADVLFNGKKIGTLQQEKKSILVDGKGLAEVLNNLDDFIIAVEKNKDEE